MIFVAESACPSFGCRSFGLLIMKLPTSWKTFEELTTQL